MVTTKLEYAATVWSLRRKKHERIQRAATKLPTKFERTVIQREAADTGSYNIGAEEGKKQCTK